MTVLIALSGALCVAAAVSLTWWLGVWGWFTVLRRRVEQLEDDGEYLRTRFQREDGRKGRAVQQRARTKEEAEMQALEAAALEERKTLRRVPDVDGDVDLSSGRSA